MNETQKAVDTFYIKNGPCCAGCDYWRFYNSVIGECIESAPVSAKERVSMLNYKGFSGKDEAGHILTKRDHYCGDFIDTYDWGDMK